MPAADPTGVLMAALPAKLTLDEGELVVLAIKPSLWFIPLASWPVLAVAAFIALGTSVTGAFPSGSIPQQTVTLICAIAAALRVAIASGQWIGRLYILTTLRVIRVSGMLNVELSECTLRKITQTSVSCTKPEQHIGVGTLHFHAGSGFCDVDWIDVAKPEKLKPLVDEYLTRAHK